jgi:hypothetical protein
MTDWNNTVRSEGQELGALTSDLSVRVLNGSAAGCLVESPRALQVGTVAGLRVNFRGHDYDDPVKVTRCQSIVGAGVFHIGMEFLSMVPPYAGTLRYAIHRELGQFTGCLHAKSADDQP